MNRNVMIPVAMVLLAAPLARVARAEGGAAPSGGATVQADVAAGAEAATRAEMQRVRDAGLTVKASARARADAKLGAAAGAVDHQASAGTEVATRLAAEFGLTATALMDEHQQLDASWGTLMIAHTLAAGAATNLTVPQLVQLHDEGTGWGQIAAGLGLKLGDVVSAARTEARVATGEVKADGRVATMRGEGARNAGRSAGANAGASATATAGHGAGAGVGLGAGVGVHIKP
jgi:hypothetical protein